MDPVDDKMSNAYKSLETLTWQPSQLVPGLGVYALFYITN
jgi:hypothetical protein